MVINLKVPQFGGITFSEAFYEEEGRLQSTKHTPINIKTKTQDHDNVSNPRAI